MDTKDKIYGSDILLGNVDPDDLMLGPSFTNSLHDELFKAKPKKVEVKKPQRPVPTQRPKAIPRTTMVKGKPGEFNLAEPAKKLGALKQNIHSQDCSREMAIDQRSTMKEKIFLM